ncbi:MAG: HAD family hydrolase [Lachnospiraceae bacterium]|nr:HAD family hydrolase [Lachnospiraceae bacterium]
MECIMKKAIFWDSDGTLLYGNESFTISIVRAFEEFGYSMNEETARNRKRNICSWDVPWKDHSNKDGEQWWKDLLEDIRAFCRENNVRDEDIEPLCISFRKKVITYEYEAYPDAKEVLHYFKENGYENYIISNNFPELGSVFERLGMGKEISGYFTSAAVGYEKPNKEIFEYAIEKAGNPDIKYMIGDNPLTDYEGGMNAGLTPILVHNKVEGKVCCESLVDLMGVIEE